MRAKVLLDPHRRKLDNIFSPEDMSRLHSLADIVWGRDEPAPPSEIEKYRDEVSAVITGYWGYGDVGAFPQLRGILEVSGGFASPNDLDYPACFARGIQVLSCAPAFGPAVAELGLGLALAAARQISHTDAAFRTGEENWSHTEFKNLFLLYDKPVGFIGFGGLARSLKPLLAPFRCPIQVYDPWLTDSFLRTQGVTPVDLDTLLVSSRIIFVLAAPSASNAALLDREKLKRIAPDAVFVLLSRSHVVDFDALTDLLTEGRFTAAIDVFPKEPLPIDHPIRRLDNVILSSHRAGAHPEALRNIGRIVVNDLEALLRGLPTQEMQAARPEYIRLRG
ncbi:MAG TPA: NAD(P)-dependent oxidoreductase [Armatimonadota bacterium]|nr:NAD(P)-dependent oxidoreductase [Armatimonadota bacterium]